MRKFEIKSGEELQGKEYKNFVDFNKFSINGNHKKIMISTE